MKKTLIALAVAGVVAAPAAFAATSNVDIYGKVRMSMDRVDIDGTGSQWQIEDRVSRVGVKGSEDLGGGLKAIWQVEQGVAVDSAGAFGGADLRNTFVGLNGGFGTVLMGRHDTPYKIAGSADLFADTIADSQSSGGIIGYSGFDTRASNTVAYITPTMSGLHAAVALVPGEAAGTNADGLADAYSMAAMYNNGPFNASLGYENYDNIADNHAMKVNVGYTMGNLKFGGTYEKQTRAAANLDAKNYLVSAAYGMGNITLMAQYGNRNSDTDANDKKRFVVGAGYAFSKRTDAYLAYMNDNNGTTTADVTGVTLGLNHSF
jgi:predicted porin